MQNLFKIGFIVLVMAFSSSLIYSQDKIPVTKSRTTQKTKQTTKNETFYVDVRTPAEFAQGSVKGAINIPLDQIENQLAKFKGKKNIVVFCRSGNRSSQAKVILEQNGFTNIKNGGSWEDVNAKLKK
ncbi:rhodanese-like domain-containing protein [Flavobacterium sp.]|uniref:rhodanese-like domain-containing protein n=1 Tax=Flavobacterium sp. TaxID=239 RepID=UPI0025BA3F3E|nr:rhodanese-like domain-containing protein [Flavobacterium sp.]